MCLRPLLSKALREVWDIAPMGQCELSYLCLRIGQSKSSMINGGDRSNVYKTIAKQGTEGSLEYCANGPIGVRSPMSKTRPKQGIEDKWGDCSNVSNNIVNQGTEVSLGYCANGPMDIGK